VSTRDTRAGAWKAGVRARLFARDDPTIGPQGDDMATCASCGKTIESGGIRLGDRTFCDGTCLDTARALEGPPPAAARGVGGIARQIHAGPCPKCQGPGPVDVHDIYWVWSAIVFTRWGTRPQVSCRWCGIKSQVGGILQSIALGWWGFPWGIILTPVQIFRNAVGIISPPSPDEPSSKLRAMAGEHENS
jgi:hypothetical protein